MKLPRRAIILVVLLVATLIFATIVFSTNQTIGSGKQSSIQPQQITEKLTNPESTSSRLERGLAYRSYVEEFALSASASAPLAIYVDNMNRVWFTENNLSRLAVLFPANGSIKEYPVPYLRSAEMDVWDLIADDEGNIWFPETNLNALVKFDPKANQFSMFRIPTESSYPFKLKLNEGKIWFTELRGGKIGWFDTRDYSMKEFDAGVVRNSNIPALSGPAGIDIDSNGHVWFAKSYSFYITEFSPENGQLIDYSLPETFYSPTGLMVDFHREGLWVTEHGGSRIAFFSLTNKSITAIHTSPAVAYPISLPLWTVMDDQGRVWFNEHTGNTIGRLDINRGYMVEYHLPSNEFYYPLDVSLDSDGQLWFTEYAQNKIAVLRTSKTLPFSFTVERQIISVHKGEIIPLTIAVSKTEANEPLNLSIGGQLSSRWPMKIEPENIKIDSTDALGHFNVLLEFPKEMGTGKSLLTLSLSDGTITYSRIIAVDVS